MRFKAVVAAVVLSGLAGAGVLAAVPAYAAGVGVDDVVTALGRTSEPADYVVMVDTSGSMNAGGLYAGVRRELGKLVGSLDSDDRVSLMTFDSTVVSRFSGVVGKNPSAVLAGLPSAAGGLHTDLGTAIAAGLTQLEKPSTFRMAALILITDGKLDAPGSKFAKAGNAAWKSLKTRATALGGTHEVAAYAVSLRATTDAALLKQVFPRASEVAAADVGTRFAQVSGDLIRLQAAADLKDEVAQPIQVNWTGDLGAGLANGTPVDVQLELVSPYAHIPVKVSHITAVPTAGLHVQLTDLKEPITLEPRATVTVSARVVVTGSGGPAENVGLSASVDSSWSKALQELGLTFRPALTGSAPVPAAPIKLPPNLLPVTGGIVGLALAVLLVLLLARMLLTPSMSGVLTFRAEGRELAEIVVKGRRMKLVAPAAATDLTGLSGTATGARGAGSDRVVRLDARFGDAGARGLVPDGGTIELGGMVITYTSGRRRILDKIGVPRPDGSSPGSPASPSR